MLVLGRKENQRLIIDGKIVVTIVRASGGNVRLGIEAPPNVSVQREEILGRLPASRDQQLAASR